MLLQDAQQFGLHGEGQFADFVKKERAAIGQLKTAGLVLECACECAAGVAKELALEQVFGNGTAVDFDKRAFLAQTVFMDGAGDEFLTRAAFAGDEHAALRGGHQRHIVKEGPHERAGRDNVGRQPLIGVEFERSVLRQAGGLAHGGEQFVQVDRFGKIIDSTVPHGADGVADIGISGDQKNGKRTVFLARQAQGVQAGESGHADVGDHHVDLLLAQHFQGALAGGNGHGLEALAG